MAAAFGMGMEEEEAGELWGGEPNTQEAAAAAAECSGGVGVGVGMGAEEVWRWEGRERGWLEGLAAGGAGGAEEDSRGASVSMELREAVVVVVAEVLAAAAAAPDWAAAGWVRAGDRSGYVALGARVLTDCCRCRLR